MKRLIALSFLALAGCTTASTTVSANDPKPTNVEAKAKAAIRGVLKDPFSVREFKLSAPHRAVDNFRHPNAWNVCASFYAKNSYGAYNRGLYLVFFKNNQVVDVVGGPQTQAYPECEPMRAVAF